MTKAAYARHRGVSPSAISQYIARGHLTPPALRGDGRVDSDLADEQLGGSVQPVMQAAKTTPRNEPPPIRTSAAPPSPAWSPSQGAQLQLLRARALSASVDAERKRRELNEERGKYMLAADAEIEWMRVLAGFITDVEQSIADLAIELALSREQVVALRRWWRNQRSAAAERNRSATADLIEFVTDDAA